MAELNEVNEIENELEDDIITLTDDEGNDCDFYHLATLDYNENWYMVVQPVELFDGMTEEDVIIYKIDSDEDGESTILAIEDDAEADAVFNEFERLMSEGECSEDGCKDCGCDHCNC